MIHIIKQFFEVKFNNVMQLTELKSATVTMFAEVHFTDRLQYLLETLLNQPIPNTRHSQWKFFPCSFGMSFRWRVCGGNLFLFPKISTLLSRPLILLSVYRCPWLLICPFIFFCFPCYSWYFFTPVKYFSLLRTRGISFVKVSLFFALSYS